MANNQLITIGGERYLNRVNFQYPMSTDLATQYLGLLGSEFTLTQAEAEAMTDTTVTDYSSTTKLGPGTYKIVKFASSLTITPARGLAVYWKAAEEPNAYVVTTDAPTGGSQFAGVCINAVTAGYYGVIKTSPGTAHVKGKASLSNTGAVGQALVIDAATGTFDNPYVGTAILSVPVELAQVTGAGDILTNWTPGFAGRILTIDALVTKVVTTAAKAMTINMEIGTTNLTGGTVALTSANCTPLGAKIAGAAITAANTFTASDTISVEAASVTAFAEGSVVLLITYENSTLAGQLKNSVLALEAPASGSLKKAYIAATVQDPTPGNF